MHFFFEPQGVAVIGASPEPQKGGNNLIRNLILGYQGAVYPVNPKYTKILDHPCYPSVSDIPDPVDLAIIFIPAPGVPEILRQCAAKKVKGVIIESGGFAEVGPEGKALQEECLAIARKGGLRLWGPNCMGYMDTRKRHVFSFITPDAWQDILNPGGVSLIVQSGLLSGGFVTTLMDNKILSLSKVCSIGNKCDVEETEILEYLLNDPATKVIGLYLESFPKGRRFFELAREAQKPIVVLKGGKSPSGAKAASSHTGSLAGDFEIIRGALDQAGVIQVDDFFELADMARTLDKDFLLPRLRDRKPRLAIFSYSGAANIVTTDHLEKYGMTLAVLSPQTQTRLEALSPSWMPVNNPVDFWPAMEKNGPVLAYQEGLAALHEDPEIDGIIVHMFAGFGVWFLNMKEIMSSIKGPRKPILFWVIGHEKGLQATRLALEADGWPVFTEISRVARVMAGLFEQAPRTTALPAKSAGKKPEALLEKIQAYQDQGLSVLDEFQAKDCLKTAGLPVVEERRLSSLEGIIATAQELGYPIVLKGLKAGRIHKTEAGWVKLNLHHPDQVQRAFQEIAGGAIKPDAYIVQPMLKGELELIAGMLRDPQFGPAVMLGLGGVRAEVYKDVVFRLAPLNREDVIRMVSKLKGRALLKGFRGARPVDLNLLAQWLIGLGDLSLTVENIREIDVNPLLIVEGRPVAVDATLILE